MVKHISMIMRHPHVSLEELRRYWIEVHAPLVRTCLPGLRKYVGNFVCSEGAESGWGLENRGNRTLDCDLIVELHFDNLAALQEAMLSPAWLNDKRRASSGTLIDYPQMRFTIAEEHDVPLQGA